MSTNQIPAAAHVPSESQQVFLANSTNTNAQDQQTTDSSLDPQTKKKLMILGIIAVIIIIVVTILAIVIGTQQVERQTRGRWPTGDCGCNLRNTTLGDDEAVCGDETAFSASEHDCPTQCDSISGFDNLNAMYYIRNTSSCYCFTHIQARISWQNETKYFEESCVDSDGLDVRKWEYSCCVYGRPYWIDWIELESDVKYMDCNDYVYYDDDNWKQFMIKSNYTDDNMLYKWIKQGLSEYASIGSFAKFSLELMSIGAPLWFIELSNNAALDEIKHTQISFDIANIYLNGEQCIGYGVFPEHRVDINGDWNDISKDAAIGGCIGETLSALKMVEDKYNNMMDEYVHEMAMDEIKHAALSWITVKWMIDNSPNGINMDVASKDWWSKRTEVVNEEDVHIITSILNKMWMDYDYNDLYELIIGELESQLNTAYCYSDTE